MNTADFLIIGGGVVGISIARELKSRNAGAKIVLLEKEPDCGLHASGRNSGVIHAGFLLHGGQPQGAAHARRQPPAHRILREPENPRQ